MLKGFGIAVVCIGTLVVVDHELNSGIYTDQECCGKFIIRSDVKTVDFHFESLDGNASAEGGHPYAAYARADL